MPPIIVRRKRYVGFLVVALVGASVLVVLQTYDPERKAVELAFNGYFGDVKHMLGPSAASRVFPEDLAALKEAALLYAGSRTEFRADAFAFLGVTDAAGLGRQTKERFFEFLLDRTRRMHPEVLQTLNEGRLMGTKIRRRDDVAYVEATFAVETSAGPRRFVMRLQMLRSDDIWFVRI